MQYFQRSNRQARPIDLLFVGFVLMWVLLGTTQVGAASSAKASSLQFTIHKSDNDDRGHTVLVIGGIQGDEPGGFHAASLLVTHYQFSGGNVWVVPNLNFESIVKRSRGVYGDMNRKFPVPKQSDPDYESVQRIKALIEDEAVDYIFNLHDGSGFYRTRHTDRLHSPLRWGQSIIIDQKSIGDGPLDKLDVMAERVRERINKNLLKHEHRYHVKNTRTREGDKEMEKTLTYYAINHGKPAVGIEASKSLNTPQRVFYHLQAMEAYLTELGIQFTRGFKLSSRGVGKAINEGLQLALYDDRIRLDVAKARKNLRYVPMLKGSDIRYQSDNPLLAVINRGTSKRPNYRVAYGNRRITNLHPQYFTYDNSSDGLVMTIDGVESEVPFGSVVDVKKEFEIQPQAGYRTNVIGWRTAGAKNEAGYTIRRKAILKRYSIDRDARIFRVEQYHDKSFSGMVLVRFVTTSAGALKEGVEG